jgi:hypothetical protein
VSEKRPFRRLLDDEYAALHAAGPSKPKPSASSMPSKPQAATAPRANPNPDFLLTPLRKLPQVRGTPAEVDATLSALENVIESLNTNFSLKRARTESRTLRDRHAAASARFAELERLIAAAKVRSEAPPEPAPAPAPQEAEEEKPPMSVDEAIAAEEEALRALEAALAPARRERVLKPTTPRPPRASASPKASPKNPSPRVRNSLATKQQTPTKPLSIGVTPQRPALTPRAPNVAANQNQNQNQPRQSIFGPPRANATPARLGPLALFGGATPRARTAATPRRAPLASIASPEPATPAPAAALPAATPAAPTPAPAPVPPTPAAEPEPQTRTVAGVEVDHPAMLGVIVSYGD